MKDISVIMADCHICNFGKIDIACESQNINLASAEFIKQSYSQWGGDCPNYMLGDFSFALLDNITNDIFCARDPIGVKPFYYTFAGGKFTCSTDIEELLALPEVPSSLDDNFVSGYLQDKYFSHKERTFFKYIKKLPPGYTLTITSQGNKLKRYWFPENVPEIRFKNDLEYSEALLKLYTEVISDYVSHPEPIAIELSGGLDSSSVVVLATRELRKKALPDPLIYSWHPLPKNVTELPGHLVYDLIDDVCNQEKLTPQHVFPDVNDIKQYFQRDPTRQPTTSVLLHQLPIQKMAQEQGVKTILSGWGGDECITSQGKGYYFDLLKSFQLKKLHQEIFATSSSSPCLFMAKTLVGLASPIDIGDMFRQHMKSRNSLSFIDSDFVIKASPLRPDFKFRPKSIKHTQIQRLSHPLMSERLEATAASGAKHGISYRYPLLDRRLLEFGLGLPPEQFVRGKTRRWLARKTFEKILPKSVCGNTDKSDNLRVEAIRPVLYSYVKEITKSWSTEPIQSKYVDTDSLLNFIESDRFRIKPQLGKIRNAILFLNTKL